MSSSDHHDEPIAVTAARHGIDRRALLRWSCGIAGILALPVAPFGSRIAHAMESTPRLPVLWLSGQGCSGDSEGLLRTAQPTPSQLILDQISLDYAELLMAAAGTAAEGRRDDTISRYAGKYVVVVEGSIPTANGGVACCVGGRSILDIVRQASATALAVIAVGSCAADGGLPRASGGVTGAASVSTVLAGTSTKILNFPGCPMNIQNLTAALVQYMTLGTWPETDKNGLPLFAYGARIHRSCERLPFFRAGMFVETWGDAGHQAGWCLGNVGCQGPRTSSNCPTSRFNTATSWPVGSGAPCMSCTRSDFWSNLDNVFDWIPPTPTATPPPTPTQNAPAQPGIAGPAVGAGTSHSTIRDGRAM